MHLTSRSPSLSSLSTGSRARANVDESLSKSGLQMPALLLDYSTFRVGVDAKSEAILSFVTHETFREIAVY